MLVGKIPCYCMMWGQLYLFCSVILRSKMEIMLIFETLRRGRMWGLVAAAESENSAISSKWAG